MKKMIMLFLIVFVLGGTGYSQTPAPPDPVEIRLDIPANVTEEDSFTVDVFIDSNDIIIAAVDFTVHFNDSIIGVKTSVGINGVVEQPDGFVAAASVANDQIRITGFDAFGKGPGTDLHFATIYFDALSEGTTDLEVENVMIADVNGVTLPYPVGTGGRISVSPIYQEPPVVLSPTSITIEFPENTGTTTVISTYMGYSILNQPDWVILSPSSGGSGTVITVTIDWSQFEPGELKRGTVTFLNQGTTGLGFLALSASYSILLGDVNGNGSIDIIDALLTAQYYVQMNPAHFIIDAADVNRDGSITIVDALLIAQYYVNGAWNDSGLFNATR